jgi:regulator of PEP synthase PpsR (kinase-PPPase family)
MAKSKDEPLTVLIISGVQPRVRAMAKSKDEPLTVLIISGSTGHTVQQVVNAALAQFDSPNVRIVKKTRIRSSRAAAEVVRQADGERTVICHSLVTPKVRDAALEEAKRRMIPTVDVLGRVLAILGDHLGVTPHGRPGLSYARQKSHFDLINAVSFTLDHDDGAGLHDLAQADVVLVGVSRASKSVTCFYLGYRGIRAANVPLIPGCDPPQQLLKMPVEKVIGLTVTPNRLQSVRQARRAALGQGPLDYYVDPAELSRELRYALGLMKKYGWRCIDVSYMAVEEVAKQVMGMIGK